MLKTQNTAELTTSHGRETPQQPVNELQGKRAFAVQHTDRVATPEQRVTLLTEGETIM